ncbi:SusC/RagA family TonB-linked outer membrane protein [Belliella aquatica]|uniref:SusC/RagA family TonB-linked outer membrane protein n=1 Tax=Belliella aquatica TaxID=1323734 RepID=A0ABQ1LUC6_9BACT|nr:TonB-dependent receptor [Belliella aquatica]MCH7404562.1 TonB-dependent receptor [Belliella aquatica]GGC29139.1 SusC/RagA family TonB-linked outer membrane protein [Belliella aquatica]
MRKALLLIVTLFAFSLHGEVWAQQRQITGTVLSAEDNLPLPGVNVRVKGSTRGSVSNIDGEYSIQASNDETLIFSFIGFTTQEVSVGNRSTIDLTLELDSKILGEVVVTGYKTQNSREIAGSVNVVSGEQIREVPIGSFDQALQGRAPGVLIQANSGQPGAAASVTIRGKGTINGSNDPLYILDGIQITAADFATLNPNDFESFSILKDASSTSIYGSRGANGVIVITTKRGKSGKTRVNYDFQTGFSQAPSHPEQVMNTAEKLEYELANGNPYGWSNAELEELRQTDTNWEDVLLRTGYTQNHQISASGGNDNTTFFLSGSVFDQTGTVPNTDLKRYTARMNVETKLNNFTFGMNVSGGYSKFNNTLEGDSFIGSPLNAIRWSNPYETPYQADGSYTQLVSGQPNALQELLQNQTLRNQIKGVAIGFVQYDAPFLEGLSFRTNWGIDYTQNETQQYLDRESYRGFIAQGRNGSLDRGFNRNFRYTGTTSISYKRQINVDNEFSVSLYNEVLDNDFRSFGFTGFGLVGPFQNEAGITPGNPLNGFIPVVRGNGGQNALVSYFADATYGYKGRYFLSGGIRRDGSSRFGADNKYATFGSLGASWIVSDEEFMQSLKGNFFNELKFKISYGTVGNQEGIGNFDSRERLTRSIFNGIGGFALSGLPNPALRWEKQRMFNTGVEFALAKGKINGIVEYYDNVTDDLFLNRQLSRTSGFVSQNTNIGSMRNRGVEVSFIGKVIDKADFKWELSANITYNQNEVLSLVGDQDEFISGDFITRIGEPINSLYLVRFDGVDPANGDALYLNSNNETTNVYNPADRTILGTTDAPWFGGFGTMFSYKNFRFDALFSYVSGNVLYNNDRNNIENPAYLFDNLSRVMINEWRTPGQITDIPAADNPFFSGTSRFVESGDFIRLRNVNLSYTIPSATIEKLKIASLRVFVQGQNLLTFTDFRGFDPELSGNLIGSQYPALRTVTFGVNVGF